MEEAKCTYSPLGKYFEKQTKRIKDRGERQVNALKSLESSDKQLPSIKDSISKERLNPETVDEIEKIEEEERKADRSKMVYDGYNKNYDFRKFETIRLFGNEIRNNIINMSIANEEQDQLSEHVREFKRKTRPQNSELERVKEDVLNSVMALPKGIEMVFKSFERGIFSKPEELNINS